VQQLCIIYNKMMCLVSTLVLMRGLCEGQTVDIIWACDIDGRTLPTNYDDNDVVFSKKCE
jgi:hypothetical protein